MKEHYTITLQDGNLKWVLCFDDYFKWVLSGLLMRVVLRLCAGLPAAQRKQKKQDYFPEYLEEEIDPTEGYEPVRFVEGSSIDLETLADDEMTLPEPPKGWRIYRRKQ